MEFTLKEVIWLGGDLYSLRIRTGLNDRFPYLPGNSTVVHTRRGREILQGYLLSNPFLDDELIVTGFSRKKISLKPGATVSLAKANGNFVLRPVSDYRRHFLFFAEGAGILPVVSMVNAVLRIENRSSLRLVWVDSGEAGFFLNQLSEWEAMVHGRMDLIVPEHRNDLRIWLNSWLTVPGDRPHRVYISGTDGFITELICRLTEKGFSSRDIYLNRM